MSINLNTFVSCVACDKKHEPEVMNVIGDIKDTDIQTYLLEYMADEPEQGICDDCLDAVQKQLYTREDYEADQSDMERDDVCTK